MLLGYYPLTDGQVLLDGQSVDTRDLAQLISFVPQDTSLFFRSIADNIAYAADRQVSRQAIIRAFVKRVIVGKAAKPRIWDPDRVDILFVGEPDPWDEPPDVVGLAG